MLKKTFDASWKEKGDKGKDEYAGNPRDYVVPDFGVD